MQIDSLASLGLLGIQKGMQGARAAATEIASSEQAGAASPTDVAAAMIALKQSELQVAASAKTISSANQMIGSLIDTLA
jgi:hypothetical protein